MLYCLSLSFLSSNCYIFITLIERSIFSASKTFGTVEIFESAITTWVTRSLRHDFNGENSIALLTLISAYHADCNIAKFVLLQNQFMVCLSKWDKEFSV